MHSRRKHEVSDVSQTRSFWRCNWAGDWGTSRSGTNNSAIFSEIVPEQLRSAIYAFDRSFEGAIGATAAPLVGTPRLGRPLLILDGSESPGQGQQRCYVHSWLHHRFRKYDASSIAPRVTACTARHLFQQCIQSPHACRSPLPTCHA